MKQLIIALALTMPTLSMGATNPTQEYYQHGSAKLSKVEALRTLLTTKDATIYRCQQVEVSDKATIRNKKKASK